MRSSPLENHNLFSLFEKCIKAVFLLTITEDLFNLSVMDTFSSLFLLTPPLLFLLLITVGKTNGYCKEPDIKNCSICNPGQFYGPEGGLCLCLFCQDRCEPPEHDYCACCATGTASTSDSVTSSQPNWMVIVFLILGAILTVFVICLVLWHFRKFPCRRQQQPNNRSHGNNNGAAPANAAQNAELLNRHFDSSTGNLTGIVRNPDIVSYWTHSVAIVQRPAVHVNAVCALDCRIPTKASLIWKIPLMLCTVMVDWALLVSS